MKLVKHFLTKDMPDDVFETYKSFYDRVKDTVNTYYSSAMFKDMQEIKENEDCSAWEKFHNWLLEQGMSNDDEYIFISQ